MAAKYLFLGGPLHRRFRHTDNPTVVAVDMKEAEQRTRYSLEPDENPGELPLVEYETRKIGLGSGTVLVYVVKGATDEQMLGFLREYVKFGEFRG